MIAGEIHGGEEDGVTEKVNFFYKWEVGYLNLWFKNPDLWLKNPKGIQYLVDPQEILDSIILQF
jgi:hypothetical protein